MKLNAKQRIFVREYLKDKNATRAYRAAYGDPKGADRAGSRLLRNVGVSAAIERGLAKQEAKLELSAERNLQRLAHWAYHARVKSGDSIKACELIGKHFKQFTDSVEFNTKQTARVVLMMPPNGSEIPPKKEDESA